MDASLLPILITAVAAGCLVAAAWPIVWLPRFRLVLAGVSGSTCIASGIAAVTFLAGGLMPLPAASTLLAASDPLASSAPESGSSSEEALPETETKEADSQSASETPPPDDDPIIDAPPETPIIPPGRPAWVEADDVLGGPVHSIHVSSGPFAREVDSRRSLDRELVAATNKYLAEQLNSDLAPTLIGYDAGTIRARFIRPDNVYDEVIITSVGPMHQTHALLEFDEEFRQEITRRWSGVTATSRLTQVGLFAGGALLLLGSVFSYFRLDNATRGYYTGRLQFMAAAAILTIVGAGALLAQWITWL